jgi:predicted RNA-binding protein with PIN domain
MRWLLDGYNVIRHDAEMRSREAERLADGRTALLHLVAAVARRCGDDFTVVFDGARAAGGEAVGGQVQVIFSRPPQNADQVLIRLATQYRDASIVVSSDRTVRDASRRAGAAVVSADEFLEAAGTPEPDAQDAQDEKENEEDDDESPPAKHGNPHRLSRQARATRRALGRLRSR